MPCASDHIGRGARRVFRLVPGAGNPFGESRFPVAPVPVGMQPFHQEAHVLAEFLLGRRRRRAENAIGIGALVEQDLLQIEDRRFANEVRGPPGPGNRLR